MRNSIQNLFDKKYRFSIRKLSVGTCSVIIGAFLLGQSPSVSAQEAVSDTPATSEVEPVPAGAIDVVEPAASAEAAPTATDTPAATDTPTETASPAEAPATETPSPAATEAASSATAEDKAVAPDWTAVRGPSKSWKKAAYVTINWLLLLRMITVRTLPSLRKRGWKWIKTAMPVST